jgi:sugar phosphate isomerase/epimerase
MDTQRRDFIKKAAAASALALLPDFLEANPKKMEKGLQLFTVAGELMKDVAGTLQHIGEIGYKRVEGFSLNVHYFGMKPANLKKIMTLNGLSMPSAHIFTGRHTPEEMAGILQAMGISALPPVPDGAVSGFFNDNLPQLMDAANEIGQKFLVCVMTFPSERNTPDACKRTAEFFNQTGEACKKQGLQFCYHNHDFEFEKLENGQTAFDIFLQETDPSLVKFELDLYWTIKAGLDPVALIEKHPGRFPLWHVKDMDNTPERFFTEVGTGTIDFKKIFKSAKKSGLEQYFVEQDVCKRPPLESIKISYDNLVSMKI